MSEQQPPREGAQQQMSFWDHLDELRRVLMRMALAVVLFGTLAFLFKEPLFEAILAPARSDFILYGWINRLADALHLAGMHIAPFRVELINIELSAQFMTHLSVAIYTGALVAAPYLAYLLFGFIQPALYEHERRYSGRITVAVFLLFYVGVAVNYLVIFPVSVRFLGTYQVSEAVANTITLSSYISTFTTLSLMSGLIFQVPVLAYFLARMGLIDAPMLTRYRRHAVVAILIVSAIITPPDVFSLLLMSVPMYLLYEAGIVIARHTRREAPRVNE